MKQWPSTLPQVGLVDGYQSGTGDGRLRSEVDAGTAKVRRRFSAVVRPLSIVMEMTADQLATFRAFVSNDLAGGIMPFQFPAQDEAGTWIVQFGRDMPTWSPRGLGWAVKLDMVILP